MMMAIDLFLVRRPAGQAMVAGLLLLWVSWLELGVVGLVLRILAFALLGLSFRWGVNEERKVTRRLALFVFVLAAMGQLQNFYRGFRVAQGSDEALAFIVVDNIVPVLLVLALAMAPRFSPRRSEVALLWTSFGLLAVGAMFGIGMGDLALRGEATYDEYRNGALMLRFIGLAPAVAAAVLLMTPGSVLLSTEEMATRARKIAEHVLAQAKAQSAEPDEDTQVEPSEADDALRLLELRLARGEISEATYLAIRDRYAPKAWPNSDTES